MHDRRGWSTPPARSTLTAAFLWYGLLTPD